MLPQDFNCVCQTFYYLFSTKIPTKIYAPSFSVCTVLIFNQRLLVVSELKNYLKGYIVVVFGGCPSLFQHTNTVYYNETNKNA